MNHWLELGLDGFRADAVPYLFEREQTSCENLPETHAYLKQLRRRIDARYRGRIMLAEANQWPADLLPYFGDGDEFHMAFNFPIMPRMYMAIRREERRPIIDIVQQTPEIPDNCQWCLFLRNHDELTLEMVTDEERDYMWAEYARDPRMKLNLGIRRRLAPLLENGRRRIELLNAMLMSLPGSPIIYYGDELGMGDNIYPRRPQRRAHADAVERRPQRRLFARRERPAVRSADRRPAVRLPVDQCRGAAAHAVFAAELDEAADPVSASATKCSGAATSLSCIRRTRRCWCTPAATRTSTC